MRMMVAMGFAILLLDPASAAPQADAGRAPIVSVQPDGDLSAVQRKKVKRKPVKQEQYLRAVPSTPPPGTKK